MVSAHAVSDSMSEIAPYNYIHSMNVIEQNPCFDITEDDIAVYTA